MGAYNNNLCPDRGEPGGRTWAGGEAALEGDGLARPPDEEVLPRPGHEAGPGRH